MKDPTSNELFNEVKQLIEEGRTTVAQTVNVALTATYWKIGKKINEEVLRNQRAGYGKQIVASLARQLQNEYGSGFSEKHLRKMMQFHETFPDFEIVATLWRQLSWSHFRLIMTVKNDLARDFYTEMCRIEKWSVRTLRKKIDSMLFERTAISRKPEELAKLELQQVKDTNQLSPDLVFRNPYVLDFLDLKDTFQEKDLEAAIIAELEKFILELGVGFAFVARQKHMIIDGEDYRLDLLFYHRDLMCLVAIDLKIGKFKAKYKGQMELYLRWLEEYETKAHEKQPIGIILCAEGNYEQIELLQLDKVNIKVAEYITQHLPKELLAKKLQQFMKMGQQMMNDREEE